MIRILVIDDEENVLKQIVNFLKNARPPQGETFEVEGESNYKEAQKRIGNVHPQEKYYHVIVTDTRMGYKETEGLDIIRFLNIYQKSPITIVLTAYASIPNCVAAMRAGAWDYLEKTPEDGSDPYENLLKSIKAAYNERLKNPYRDRVHPDAKWVQEHMDELMQKFGGKVVAVLDRTVVDSDSDYQALTERLSKKFQTAKPVMISIPDISRETIG